MKRLLILILLTVITVGQAQKNKITGKVIDNKTGSPLNEVIIYSVKSGKISFTNKKGEYSLDLNSNETLVFSLTNYYSIKKKLNDLPKIVKLEKRKDINLDGLRTIKIRDDYKTISFKSVDNKNNKQHDSDDNTFGLTYKDIYNKKLSLLRTFDNREVDLVGTPYLNKKFSIGQLIFAKSKVIAFAKIRYNILTEQFEVKINDKISAVEPTGVDLIIYNNRIFIPLYDNSYNLRYFEIIGIFNNKFLFKSYYAKISEDSYIEGKSFGNHVKRINHYADYFFKNNEKDILHKFKLKRKYAFMFFDNDKKVIKFIKTNNLKMKKEGDYVKVLEFYYSNKLE